MRFTAVNFCFLQKFSFKKCHKQTEPARDGFVGCLRAHWLWERMPPTTMPYSGSQVMLGSPAMKEQTKKPSREWSRLNQKSSWPSEEQRASPDTLTNILP
ncbi:hypothetical protein TNCV_1755341 [Trichonephila clavipes]|nr:hypothetical protein TNCV_1755341 [Trichonephila clavipes]